MTETRHTVLFLHVMKCGGTSFFKLGEATLGPEHSRRLVQDEVAQGRLPPDVAQCRFLHGHLSAWHLQRLTMATQVVTLLRRPAARLVSLYHFFRAMELGTAELADPAPYYAIARAAKALDLAGFLRSEEPAVRSQTSEHLVRILCDRGGRHALFGDLPMTEADLESAWARLGAMTGFGLVERYPDSLALLCRALGWPGPERQPRLNALEDLEAGGNGFQPVERQPVTPEIDAALARLNPLSNALYDRADRLLEQRLAEAATRAAG